MPYFTEMCGYDGPIYMTVQSAFFSHLIAVLWLIAYDLMLNAQHPTKAICPILLEDYRKIAVERKGDQNFFTSAMIKDCMKKGKSHAYGQHPLAS